MEIPELFGHSCVHSVYTTTNIIIKKWNDIKLKNHNIIYCKKSDKP